VTQNAGVAEQGVVRAGVLDVAYERSGPRGGWPVVLLHGFPYDVRCYDDVAARLAEAGADVVVPYLRGYGPTRFVDDATMRSGQQAALAHDLLTLLQALDLPPAIVGGFDWGGRAACLVSMLWPDRVAGLVSANGYNVLDIAGTAAHPFPPAVERKLWYQYYLHTERGAAGFALHRDEYARLLWSDWSPKWEFTDADFAATAASFQNPDYVEIVVHSYRHRYGTVPGDPAYQATEDLIAAKPPIAVPTVVLDGEQGTVNPPRPREHHAAHFPALLDHRILPAGHNIPQEDPAGFARAVLDVRAGG
jgi:pimeloyl-ACP methyl ester carboxylesterase